MKLEDALNLVTTICSDYKGTLKDHQLIQQALQVIKNKCEQEVKEIKADS